MNYLAHILLAESDELKLGNILGDFVKGRLDAPDKDQYRLAVRQGIALHRAIDTFTDTHPVVRQSIKRLQPTYHKFSGIVVDMFYDHFLATHFSAFSSVSLDTFSQDFYRLLEKHRPELPTHSHRMIDSMIDRDWFMGYKTLEGISWALQGIARRSVFVSNIATATTALEKDYEAYEKEFLLFFPEIQAYCRKETETIGYLPPPLHMYT